MKASNTTLTPHDTKSSVSPIRLKDDLINIESIKKQIKARQQTLAKNENKSPNQNSKSDLKSERQLSDPKKLLDEFLLPHATVMAYSKKKNEYSTVYWKRAVKAAALRRQKDMIKKSRGRLIFTNPKIS